MMRDVLGVVGLGMRSRRRRIFGVLAFGLVFLLVAFTMRVLSAGEEGHVEVDALFAIGGYPLVSGVLLLGWVLGRFPMIAVLALMAGLFSRDRAHGHARILLVRPVSAVRLYAAHWTALALLAFVLSALLMPAFDLLMLGEWAGPATLVLIAAYVLAYGGLVAFLSVWTRGDAWIALLLAIGSIVWEALRRAGALPVPPGARDFISLILPPQAALYQIESAFGELAPIPWGAFAYAAGYGLAMLILAGLSLRAREI